MGKLILFFTITYTFMFAQTLDLKKGYNFVGLNSNITLDKFDNSCVDYVFKYDEFWKVYITNEQDYGVQTTLNSLNMLDAIYVYANSDCKLSLGGDDDSYVNETPILSNEGYYHLNEDNVVITPLKSFGSSTAVNYSIVGGSDHSFFKIDANNNLLFRYAPDYEDPMDIDTNNIYEVKIKVANDTKFSVKTIKVEVDDVISQAPNIISKPYGIHYNGSEWSYTPQISDGVIDEVKGILTFPDGSKKGLRLPHDGEKRLFLQTSDLQSTGYKFPLGSYSGEVIVYDTYGNRVTQTFTFVTVSNYKELLKPDVDDINMVIKPFSFYEIEFTNSNNFPINYFIKAEPSYGILKNKNGKWYYYTDNADITDTFTYTAKSNSFYNESDEKTVTIKVMGNLPPVISDAKVSSVEDSNSNIDLVASDFENDIVTFKIVSQPTNGTLVIVDGDTVKYTPNSNFSGIDSFTYYAYDGKNKSEVKTVTIDVKDVNDAPIIDTPPLFKIEPKQITDKAFVIDQNSLFVSQTTLVKDLEKNSLSVIIVEHPTNGTVSFFDDASYVYAPNFGFEGVDSFSYKVSDGDKESNIVTINIDVTNAFKSIKRSVLKTGSLLSTNKKGLERTSIDSLNDDPTSNRGVEKSYTRDNTNNVVKDNITGLMWQDDGDNLQTSTAKLMNSNPVEEVRIRRAKAVNSFDEAKIYCDNLTLGGYSDWRVPMDMEFKSLIDYSTRPQSELVVDFNDGEGKRILPGTSRTKVGVFKNLVNDVQEGIAYKPGWVYTSTKENNVFMVDSFGDYMVYNPTQGRSTSYEVASRSPGVMCVRGEPLKEGNFIRNDNKEVVLDTTTNLMWQDGREFLDEYRYLQNPDNNTYSTATDYVRPFYTKSLEDAVGYCETLNFGGYNDWVLPNMNELQTLSTNVLTNETRSPLNQEYVMETDKEYQARDFQLRDLLSSTPTRLSVVSFDNSFFFDDNGNLVEGNDRNNYVGYSIADLPWKSMSLENKDEMIALHDNFVAQSDNANSFMYGGVDWAACKPFVKNGYFDSSIFYTPTEENKQCRIVGAKYCKTSNGSTKCRNTLMSNDIAFNYEKINGNPNENSKTSYDVRCVRHANDSDIKSFYDDIKEVALKTHPKATDWEYNPSTNKIINKINGYEYDRFEDTGDTIKDIMANVEIPKSFKVERLSWDNAIQKASSQGSGWRLINKEHTQHLNTWYEIDGVVSNPDDLTQWKGWRMDDIWLHRSAEVDSTEAYYWVPSKYSSDVFMQSYIDSYAVAKTGTKIAFPIKSDEIEAMAGSNQYVRSGDVVTLDGSNSHEGYTGSVTYKWEYLESNRGTDLRDKVVINNADSKVATVTIPDIIDFEKVIRFKLTLTRGAEISTDEVEMSVKSSQIVKLDSNGNEVDIDSDTYSCLKDTKTGLVWEAKTDSNKNTVYNFASIGNSYPGTCGKTSWRLPTKEEFVEAKNNPTLRILANVMNRDSSILYDGGEYDLYWLDDSSILSLIDTSVEHTAGRLKSVWSGSTAFAEEQNLPKTEQVRVWWVAE